MYVLSLMSSHSLRPSIYLLSPYKLAFHYSPAWQIASQVMRVNWSDFFDITISNAIYS